VKRYVTVILFFVCLAAPFLLRAMIVSRDAAGDGASPEIAGNAQRLVVITPHNQDIRNEFARAFSRWHHARFGRRVELDFRVPGGSNDVRRTLENSYRPYRDADGKLPRDAYVGIDVVWGGGDYFFDVELKPAGLLQPVRYDPKLIAEAFPQPTLAGVKLYDAATDPATGRPLPPAWVGVCLSSFGITYSPDLYASLGLPPPRHWHDLADPRLSGMLALADPLRSGSASVAYNMVIQRAMADADRDFPDVDRRRMADLGAEQPNFAEMAKVNAAATDMLRQELAVLRKAYGDALARGWKRGMAELLLIAANARYFTDAANAVAQDVGNGQAAAGMSIDFYGRVFEETVGPARCTFVSPRAATATTPDPVAVLHGVSGERLEVATRFVEFLISPEGQRLWIQRPGTPGGPTERALRRPPVRRDLYVANRPYWTDDVNPFEEAQGFNARAEWSITLTETRLIWAAAWMDSRAELKDAHAAILRRPERERASLLEKLADLPVQRRDVDDLRKKRKALEASAPNAVEEWKAAQRIEWSNKFRAHYRVVEAAAGQQR
jgi:iron(III) transport system substrate-binding protein